MTYIINNIHIIVFTIDETTLIILIIWASVSSAMFAYFQWINPNDPNKKKWFYAWVFVSISLLVGYVIYYNYKLEQLTTKKEKIRRREARREAKREARREAEKARKEIRKKERKEKEIKEKERKEKEIKEKIIYNNFKEVFSKSEMEKLIKFKSNNRTFNNDEFYYNLNSVFGKTSGISFDSENVKKLSDEFLIEIIFKKSHDIVVLRILYEEFLRRKF